MKRLLASLLFAVTASAQQANTPKATSLALTSPPRLVDCSPVSLSPCVSVEVTPSANNAPAPIALPPAAQLAQSFVLTGAAGQTSPFYASAGTGPDAAQHTNVVLLLIDISGSMNDPMGAASRFQTAKNAIAQFLQGMQDGTDRIAIVPFESHNVVSTIRAAVFAARRTDALAQLNALPAPGPKNNTALYQAVFSGSQALQGEVATLQREGSGAQELQPHLIVMTDGKNEVVAGDDPLLLNGDLGLQQAAAQVQAAHIDTIGIGFGERSAIDTTALQHLSTRFFYAGDATQLLDALHVSRTASSHSVTLTWLLPEDSRSVLMGRDPAWKLSMSSPDGGTLSAPDIRLFTPSTNSPVFDRKATPEELRSLISTHPEATSGGLVVLIHGLLYLAAAALLLMLWFWLPRLIWGDRHMAAPERTQRWGSERQVTSASGVKLQSSPKPPPGFQAEGGGKAPLQRSAAQTTQIQSRSEFSTTRLSFD